MLIYFAEMPHGLTQLIDAGNPTRGQGTAEEPGVRACHREKPVLQLAFVLLKGLQEGRQEVPYVPWWPGDYLLWLWGLWLSGLPRFPWERSFPLSLWQ